tara:strand:- start:853 stop:1530 length:678 start_codon:yes stop_codon:yes gene_type:complete
MSWRLAFLFPLSFSSPQEIQVEQLSAGDRGSTDVQQADGAAQHDRGSPADQITRNSQSSAAAPQLPLDETEGPQVLQLAERSDSTARDNSISSRQSGRTARTEVPSGSDRCDHDVQSTRPAVCAAVIETRAAEFRQPEPPALSPEERLLAERSDLARGRSPLDVARSVEALRSDDKDSQVLASLVLAGPDPTPQPQPEEPEFGAGTQALIDAIVSSLAGPGAVPQ